MTKKIKGLDPSYVTELNDLMQQIGNIDLEKVKLEREDKMLPMEKLVADLKRDGKVSRIIKRRSPVKKLHWKTKRKKRREYYHSVMKVKRISKNAVLLSTPEGWWEYLTTSWKRKKIPVDMTEEEWLEVVWPTLKGRVPLFARYDTNRGIALDNIYVRDNRNLKVLFDGKEHLLKTLGYTAV